MNCFDSTIRFFHPACGEARRHLTLHRIHEKVKINHLPADD
jgi:hypothetical protein